MKIEVILSEVTNEDIINGKCEIPNNVTIIGDYAFSDCKLSNITIPDSVTSIGDSAFWYCSGLTSVIIGSGVTKIESYVFAGCRSLTSITYNGTENQWDEISKDCGWNYGMGKYIIHCTDGDIEKE